MARWHSSVEAARALSGDLVLAESSDGVHQPPDASPIVSFMLSPSSVTLPPPSDHLTPGEVEADDANITGLHSASTSSVRSRTDGSSFAILRRGPSSTSLPPAAVAAAVAHSEATVRGRPERPSSFATGVSDESAVVAGDDDAVDDDVASPIRVHPLSRPVDEIDRYALATAPTPGALGEQLPPPPPAFTEFAASHPVPSGTPAPNHGAYSSTQRPTAELFHQAHQATTVVTVAAAAADDGVWRASCLVLVEGLKAGLEHVAEALAAKEEVTPADRELSSCCLPATMVSHGGVCSMPVNLLLAYAFLLRHLAASAVAVTCASVAASMRNMGLTPAPAIGAAVASVGAPDGAGAPGGGLRLGSDPALHARAAFVDALAGSFVVGAEMCTPADMCAMLRDVGLLPAIDTHTDDAGLPSGPTSMPASDAGGIVGLDQVTWIVSHPARWPVCAVRLLRKAITVAGGSAQRAS